METDQATEAEKLRRVPGIYFFDESYGRVVRIKGTGLQVFEIIKAYRDLDWDVEELRKAFHWLEAWQIQAALDYYAAYSDEVNARLAEEDKYEDPEYLYSKYPFMRPLWR